MPAFQGVPWNERGAPGRVSPRECVANARDAINRAYGRTEARHAIPDLKDGTDWLRRALEQMAEPGEGKS